MSSVTSHPFGGIEEAKQGQPSAARTLVKRRGRPRGTDYRSVDAPLHEKMRRLLEERKVPTRTAAARSVADDAYGSPNLESKITRLVRTYPFDR